MNTESIGAAMKKAAVALCGVLALQGCATSPFIVEYHHSPSPESVAQAPRREPQLTDRFGFPLQGSPDPRAGAVQRAPELPPPNMPGNFRLSEVRWPGTDLTLPVLVRGNFAANLEVKVCPPGSQVEVSDPLANPGKTFSFTTKPDTISCVSFGSRGNAYVSDPVQVPAGRLLQEGLWAGQDIFNAVGHAARQGNIRYGISPSADYQAERGRPTLSSAMTPWGVCNSGFPISREQCFAFSPQRDGTFVPRVAPMQQYQR